ncbi:MAG: FitA-like ribbon-helix-helix domain-containing protein [Actinomycetes bacterium]
MSNLQVKNVPEELHAALRARADREGTTLSELVTRLLRRELALPSMAEWLGELGGLEPVERGIETARLLDEVRGDWPVDRP